MAQNTKTPAMVLQELATKKGYGPPDYNIVFQVSGTHENRFDFVVRVAGIQATGSGPSKQIAKHQAAHNALLKLQQMGIYNPSENPVAAFKVPLQHDEGGSGYKAALNCVADLQNICMENKIQAPEYIEISSVGPPHNKEFTYECKISSITTVAKASTKKMAKQIAASEMLDRIKDTLPNLITEEKDLHKKLTDQETQAKAMYQELREIIPDKSIKIEEMPNTLVKLMHFKNLKYQDFEKDLSTPSEESLKRILDKLEVSFDIQKFQEKPSIALVTLKIDTPFTILGLGRSFDEAKYTALDKTFKVMNSYMQIQL